MSGCTAVHLDFGTGDGTYVQRTARARPDIFVLGVDASAEAMRPLARRLAGKPARGGLANALLGVLPLAQAPGELAGLVDRLTVLLPWGSLLRAVALPEPAALLRLRGLCKPGAALQVVFGHGEGDGAATEGLAAIDDEAAVAGLVRAYRAAGLAVKARTRTPQEVAALGTTWAGKLAFSGRTRGFLELTGHALADGDDEGAADGRAAPG